MQLRGHPIHRSPTLHTLQHTDTLNQVLTDRTNTQYARCFNLWAHPDPWSFCVLHFVLSSVSLCKKIQIRRFPSQSLCRTLKTVHFSMLRLWFFLPALHVHRITLNYHIMIQMLQIPPDSDSTRDSTLHDLLADGVCWESTQTVFYTWASFFQHHFISLLFLPIFIVYWLTSALPSASTLPLSFHSLSLEGVRCLY